MGAPVLNTDKTVKATYTCPTPTKTLDIVSDGVSFWVDGQLVDKNIAIGDLNICDTIKKQPISIDTKPVDAGK